MESDQDQPWACTTCKTVRYWGTGAPHDPAFVPVLHCACCEGPQRFVYLVEDPAAVGMGTLQTFRGTNLTSAGATDNALAAEQEAEAAVAEFLEMPAAIVARLSPEALRCVPAVFDRHIEERKEKKRKTRIFDM